MTSWRICAGDIVAAICLAEGIEPTRFAIRWTTPPSSSVITKGAMPPGAARARAVQARSQVGRRGPSRRESRRRRRRRPRRSTAATSLPLDRDHEGLLREPGEAPGGEHRWRSCRRWASAVGSSSMRRVWGVGVGLVDPVGLAVVPGKRASRQNRRGCGDGDEPGVDAAHAGYTGAGQKGPRHPRRHAAEDQTRITEREHEVWSGAPGGTATQQLEQAIVAEQSGLGRRLRVGGGYGVDAWTLLAAMAARTERA